MELYIHSPKDTDKTATPLTRDSRYHNGDSKWVLSTLKLTSLQLLPHAHSVYRLEGILNISLRYLLCRFPHVTPVPSNVTAEHVQAFIQSLEPFAELHKASSSFVMSVRPHKTTLLPFDGFSRNLVIEYFSKTCRENPSFITI